MATDLSFIEFACEQVREAGSVTNKKMFGEYMIYIDAKPVLLVCDNTVFVKKLESVASLLKDAACGFPYKGAKEHYILDIDDKELSLEVASELVKVTSVPQKKGKK